MKENYSGYKEGFYIERHNDGVYKSTLREDCFGNHILRTTIYDFDSEKIGFNLFVAPEHERIEIFLFVISFSFSRWRYNSDPDGFISQWLQKQKWAINIG
jgi:hypothetical protein